MAKIARADENMRCNLQGEFGDSAALVVIDGAQQATGLLCIGDCAVVCDGRTRERTA